jgi:hypothetical protein
LPQDELTDAETPSGTALPPSEMPLLALITISVPIFHIISRRGNKDGVYLSSSMNDFEIRKDALS